MELSGKAIKEFQKIYRCGYGEEISPNQAKRLGLNLLQLVYLAYQPIPISNKYKSSKNDKGSND